MTGHILLVVCSFHVSNIIACRGVYLKDRNNPKWKGRDNALYTFTAGLLVAFILSTLGMLAMWIVTP